MSPLIRWNWILVQAGTHSFPDADHVSFYSERLMPGYFVVFHELEGFLNLCCYFIPMASRWRGYTVEELQAVYNEYIGTDTYIRQALGPEVAITPCRVRLYILHHTTSLN